MKYPGKILAFFWLLAAVSVAVMAVVLLSGSGEDTFTPPPFDPEAVAGTPAVPDGLGYGQLDAKVFQAALCSKLTADKNRVNLWFTNPAGNTVWLKLRVLDEHGKLLGETGLLRSGEYVRQVSITECPAVKMPVILKLMAYEPATYHSAGAVTVNTVLNPAGS